MIQIKIPNDLRVDCATQLLSDGAMTWWETIQLRRAIETLSWDNLKTEFENQYYSKYHRKMKEHKFFALRQEGMLISTRVQTVISWPLTIRITLCPTRTIHDRKVKEWLQTRIKARLDCFTIQNSKGIDWSSTSLGGL